MCFSFKVILNICYDCLIVFLCYVFIVNCWKLHDCSGFKNKSYTIEKNIKACQSLTEAEWITSSFISVKVDFLWFLSFVKIKKIFRTHWYYLGVLWTNTSLVELEIFLWNSLSDVYGECKLWFWVFESFPSGMKVSCFSVLYSDTEILLLPFRASSWKGNLTEDPLFQKYISQDSHQRLLTYRNESWSLVVWLSHLHQHLLTQSMALLNGVFGFNQILIHQTITL